jgi:hypothetical protein
MRHIEGLPYIRLLLLQTAAELAILWGALPAYRQIMLNPQHDAFSALSSNMGTLAAVAILQCAYWYRFFKVPVPKFKPKVVASHLARFVARLSFIFGGGLFAVVFFRHLPEAEYLPTYADLIVRGIVLFLILFSLFCCTLEWERFARALNDTD